MRSGAVPTPPTALAKGTALANSHWIYAGEILNSQFSAIYNIICLVYRPKMQQCENDIQKQLWDFMMIGKLLITFNHFYIDFQWTASPSCRETNLSVIGTAKTTDRKWGQPDRKNTIYNYTCTIESPSIYRKVQILIVSFP